MYNDIVVLGRPMRNFRGATYVHVTKVDESAKAVKFQLLDNNKLFLWIPKAALKIDENLNKCADLKHWFTFNDFGASVWSRYERSVFVR
jgi:hypothetical protein